MKKKSLITVLVLIACLAFVSVAYSAPKEAGAHPSADANGNVTIPALPNGKLVKVWIWDDAMGTTQTLGAVSGFQLKPGQGFNFEWQDTNGKVWWQMITPSTQPGGHLKVDPWKNPESGQIQCKYIYHGAK